VSDTLMTLEKAAALRKPFSPNTMGKLPKPYKSDSPKGNCKECGGYHGLPAVHLDYVGHAATTDRLLAVDPEWAWEPVAFDDRGLPSLTSNGNLWIRLTVCGVTRYGVGDGKSLKECIGDAIRNAAMRFGVALDLWGKEELEQSSGPATPPAPAPRPVTAVPEPAGDIRTVGQSAALHAAFGSAGMDRDTALGYCVNVIERQIDSTKELTKREASNVLDALREDASTDVDPWAGQEPTDA
jgi:hypothetical protein